MKSQKNKWLGIILLATLFFQLKSAVSQDSIDLNSLNIGDFLDVKMLDGLGLSDEQKRRVDEAKRKIDDEWIKRSTEHEEKFQNVKNFDKAGRDAKPKRDERTPDDELARSMKIEGRKEINSRYFTLKSTTLLEILLPHQEKKLVRLFLWKKATSIGFRWFLKNDLVQTKIKMTAKQSALVDAKAADLQKEFDVELEKLKQKYRNRLTNKVLNEEQNQKLKKLVGKNIGSKGEMVIKF